MEYPFGQGIRDERIAHYTFTKPNSRSVWDNLSSVPKLVTDTTKISRSDTRLQNVYENRFHEGAVFEQVLNMVLIKKRVSFDKQYVEFHKQSARPVFVSAGFQCCTFFIQHDKNMSVMLQSIKNPLPWD